MGLVAVYPKPKLSQPGERSQDLPVPAQNVKSKRKNPVWSTNITYIRLSQGFCYLVAVMDW